MNDICIIGCGNIGRLHSRNLSKFSNLYFHSRSISSADKFFNKYQGKGVFNRFSEVLTSPEIDAVVICSPPEFHKEQIVQSLEAGKSVLVEKPMCVSEAEVGEIERAFLNSGGGILLMVAENYYYKPSLRKIKQFIKNQSIGDIQSVRVKKVLRQSTPGWKSKSGALLEGGIHFIALISDLFNDSPIKIEANFPGLSRGEVERSSIIKLDYENNATAQLTYSWNTRSFTKGVLQTSSIIGNKGKITFESNGIYIILRSNKRSGLSITKPTDFMGYKAMTRDFLKCLDDKSRTPYSDFYKAKRDLSIVFQAYKQFP
jgi:predicted dehydrogenase